MPSGSFGPRVHATVGYLTGRIGISQRDVQEVMETLLGTVMSLGSVPAIERVVSCALAESVGAVQTYVKHQPVTNVDETGWRECGQRSWLWISAAKLVTSFLLIATRGSEGAKQLLGESFEGIVGSDRWSGYSWLNPKQRQLCWAHLRRDFQAFVDRGGESERIGSALLEQTKQMFGLWHCVRDGSRADFRITMLPIEARVGELLREGTTLNYDKTRRTCQNILKLEVSLWTFVDVEGVEPTNNDAERPLRRAVLWRRKSFGTQSEAGSRFVERVLTTVTTLRQQRRDVLDYLTEACAAPVRGDKPPSLLPKTKAVNSAI
jgi:transposase